MLDNFKKKIQERIERNAVKIPSLTWSKGKGENKRTHTEEVILKRSKMPLVGDWARIYPPINENGKINVFNLVFGGKKNFIKLLLIFFLLYMVYSWATGVIGAGKEYLDGSKYVIIEKGLFDKYCTLEITGEGGYPIVDLTNVTFKNVET